MEEEIIVIEDDAEEEIVLMEEDEILVYPELQVKEVTPTGEIQEVIADEGVYGLSKVTVNKINLQDKTVTPNTYQQIITANSEYSGLDSVTVKPILTEETTITPSKESQEITPSENKYFSKVTVNGDDNLIPENIEEGKTIFGVTGTAKLEKDWQPEPDWWDIEQILADDTEDYPIKEIYLLDDKNDTTTFNISRYSYTMKILAVKTSDGAFYTSRTTHTWDKTKDKPCSKGYKTRYYICYKDKQEPSSVNVQTDDSLLYAIISNHNMMNSISFYQCKYLQFIKFINNCEYTSTNAPQFMCNSLEGIDGLSLYNLASLNNIFLNCYSLKKPIDINNTTATSISSTYAYCYSLKEINNFIIPNVTSNNNGFSGCYALEKINKINISGITSPSSMFNSLYNLKHINFDGEIIGNISFNNCVKLEHESILNILNHLKDLTGLTAQKLTLGSNLKRLSDEEKTIAINKNWTLA